MSPNTSSSPRHSWFFELRLLAILVIAALAAWTFSSLAEDVGDGDPLVHWDAAVVAWVHRHTTPTGVRFFGGITQLGNSTFTLLMAAAIAPALRTRRALLVGWLVAFLGGLGIERGVKAIVQRVRPTTLGTFVHAESFSFPSGHATNAMVAYTMLAYLLVRLTRANAAVSVATFALAGVLILLVGASRVYLGAHYPSDVLAGFAVGVGWVAICLTGVWIAERLAGRGSRVETTGNG